MKEVKAKHFARPFKEIPFKNFIQSPIGLVPKHGNKTKLIFHLSNNFGEETENLSINAATPHEQCSVKYNHRDVAITSCLEISKMAQCQNDSASSVIFLGKTDLSIAFHLLPLKIRCFCWLVLMAQNPQTREWVYFVDKCLPFGASISCSDYQRFSNALCHIMEFKTGHKKAITNYLDDFLFAAIQQ